jgi:dTDP-glucose 4,6-dehydratase/UDP-glucose 4-epimerase
MQQNKANYEIEKDILQSIERSCVDVKSFKGKTILVTGGTGFFGIWFLTCLVKIKEKIGSELRIITISRNPENFILNVRNKNILNNIEILKGNIKDINLNNIKVTHLVHMATTNAYETFSGEDQLAKIELLFNGTKNIINQCGQNLEKVLLTSSGVAYGINKNNRISENDFSGPDTSDIGSALGIGKLLAEFLVAYYAKEYCYKYSIARCFSFAGQYLPLDLHYAFGNFINNYLSNVNINIKSDGQDLRSYLYVGDAIAWLIKLLEDPDDCIYNVGSENEIKIEDLAKKIACFKNANLKVDIGWITKQDDNYKRTSYIPCTNKIKTRYPNLKEWTEIDLIINKMIT